jgi:hypothetical protein
MNPRRVFYVLTIIATCALFLFSGAMPARAQDGGSDSEQFSNGHIVSGEFLKFYRSVDNPERLFGLPITVEFDHPLQPGKRVQYFERVRMDLDPSLPAGQQVSLAPIGEYAYDPSRPGVEVPYQPNDPQCRSFSNGLRVCYSFRELFDSYGQKYFGLPVSNMVMTDENRLVQYFQNLRLEWRGEMPVGRRVVVTPLGRVDFDRQIGDPALLDPKPGPIARQVIPTLRVFPGRPLVVNGDRQKVFVILRNQFNEPIKNNSVRVTFLFPGNVQPQTISGIYTDESGIAFAEQEITGLKPNQVIQVEVEANVGSDTLKATTWFRVWW